MKLQTILITFIIYQNALFSQNTSLNFKCSDYHYLINNAKKSYLIKNDFNAADLEIQKALKINPKPFSVDLYFALKMYAENYNEQDLEKIITIAELLKSNGIKNHKILRPFKNNKAKKEVRKSIAIIKPTDDELVKQLIQIKKDDWWSQTIFVGNKRREKINTKNYNRLMAIIKEQGKWPGINLTNHDTNLSHVDISNDFTQALLHFNYNRFETLLPYLTEAVENLELNPHHFARIYDYYYFGKKSAVQYMIQGKVKPNEIIYYTYFGVALNLQNKYIFTQNNEDIKKNRRDNCMLEDIIKLD